MTIKLLTGQHLEFLSLKGGCTGLSESTLVIMPHYWKSHVSAHCLLSDDIFTVMLGFNSILNMSCPNSSVWLGNQKSDIFSCMTKNTYLILRETPDGKPTDMIAATLLNMETFFSTPYSTTAPNVPAL